MVTENKPVVVV